LVEKDVQDLDVVVRAAAGAFSRRRRHSLERLDGEMWRRLFDQEVEGLERERGLGRGDEVGIGCPPIARPHHVH
jgi:hypothetical protein